MSIPVNESLGDMVDWDTSPLTVIFHLSAKPSVTDSETMLLPEEITIFMNHVISIHKRHRTVQPTTPEQKASFKDVVVQMSKSVN